MKFRGRPSIAMRQPGWSGRHRYDIYTTCGNYFRLGASFSSFVYKRDWFTIHEARTPLTLPCKSQGSYILEYWVLCSINVACSSDSRPIWMKPLLRRGEGVEWGSCLYEKIPSSKVCNCENFRIFHKLCWNPRFETACFHDYYLPILLMHFELQIL